MRKIIDLLININKKFVLNHNFEYKLNDYLIALDKN